VLGPFEVETDGQRLDLGGPRVRAVLAVLVSGAGRTVSLGTLVEQVWGDRPPPDAARTARTYVSRLRKVAGGVPSELILTRPPGYALGLAPAAIDAVEFERLAAAGRRALRAGEPGAAGELLSKALGLWRGDAYGEFGDSPALATESARLHRLRLAATADRVDADLATGSAAELVAELEALVERHPGDERLWRQLLTALYRADRQADALEAFRRAREALVESSGIEPSPGLAEIHRQVLAQDVRLSAPRPAPAVPPAGGPASDRTAAAGALPVPAQLPRSVTGFSGRARELMELDAILSGVADLQPAPTGIFAISGTAGVGKTAFAVHWAHHVAARFCDGQLYVNLRGFHPGRQVMGPAEALRGFLDAFGIAPGRIPSGVDAQAALYRSLLAGKRVLVVLDNALDADQVRPLLPGTSEAAVVVTSRNHLTGLIADGAHPVTLDTLSIAESRDLLARRLGEGRVAAEPQAIDEIIDACARLPLALTIAAARAALRPTFPLSALAAEVGESRDRLEFLTAGEPIRDVRAVFSWSYGALTPGAARLFRLLGLHPGPDTSPAAVASLTGCTSAVVRPLLADLTQAGLLTEHRPGRYAFHDLLRAYAADLVRDTDAQEERNAAVERLLDHHLHTAYAAARLLDPTRDRMAIPLLPAAAGAQPAALADYSQAMSWLSTEHAGLVAILRLAADSGHARQIWQLAWSLASYLHWGQHWHDQARIWQAALQAAERMGDPAAEADAHRGVANVHTRQDRFADAHTHYDRALDLDLLVGDLVGQARTHLNLSYLENRQGRSRAALDHALRALDLYRGAGHRRGEAYTLDHLACYHSDLGDHAGALAYCDQAVALFQRDGDRCGEAETWSTSGLAHRHLGHHQQSVDSYEHALRLFTDLDDRLEQASVLVELGHTHRAAGELGATRAAWQQALDLLTDLEHPRVAAVRGELQLL
jgi:DNA-binding SARP family transcriptional activator